MSPDPFKPVGWGPVAAADLAWEKKAQTALDERLKSTRDAAKDWATTIASYTGILGLVALVKGREDFTEVAFWVQVLVALALLLAVAAASVAILYAALASEGTTKKFWIVGSRIESGYNTELERAERQLTVSRVTTLALPILLALAVGLTWFGPEKTAEVKPTKVLVTFANGKATCGELAAGTGSGVAVKPAAGSSISIADGTVRSLSVVSACPKAE